MPSRPRRLVPAALAGVLLGALGFAGAAFATDWPYFSCAIGSGHLSTPTETLSVHQGDAAVFTIDTGRVACDEAITFLVDPGSLSPGTTATFSENPTTAEVVTLTLKTSKTWPTITPVGGGGANIYLSTGHNDTGQVYLGVQIEVTPSAAPIAKTPTSSLGTGTLGSSTAKVKIGWGAIDPDGIRSYTLQRQKNGGSWKTIALSSKTQSSTKQSLSFGATYRYRVRATDKHGHTGVYAYGRPFKLTLVQQTSKKISSPWSWTTVHTGAASGGSYRTQRYSGSDFTYTFHAASIAWVSVRGPTRTNSSEVLLDGHNVKSNLSLKSSSTLYRRIVFARNLGANGSHSLYVINLGQIGHSRLDIDAFVLLTYK